MLKASGTRKEFAFVDEQGRIVAVLKAGVASFTIGEQAYTVTNTGQFAPIFELWRDGERVASAAQAALVNRYTIDCAGKAWRLNAVGLTGRKFALLDDKVRVGAISPKWYNPYRQTTVDLPGEIPVEVQIFLTWIVARHWESD